MKEVVFEKALRDLEDAVARLESGDLSLEESLSCFENGVRSAQQCRKVLESVEARVEILMKAENGELQKTAFPPQENNDE